MESRQLDDGPLGCALHGLGTAFFVAGLAAALAVLVSYRDELIRAIEQGTISLWPLPVALCGMVLFLTAKISAIRRGRFFTFGAGSMSPAFAALYSIGYVLMIIGYAGILGAYLLSRR